MTHHSFYVSISLQIIEIEKNLNGDNLNSDLCKNMLRYKIFTRISVMNRNSNFYQELLKFVV